MTIIDSGIASPTRASAPTAIHGSLMRSVSLYGLEDSVLRVVESGGGSGETASIGTELEVRDRVCLLKRQ